MQFNLKGIAYPSYHNEDFCKDVIVGIFFTFENPRDAGFDHKDIKIPVEKYKKAIKIYKKNRYNTISFPKKMEPQIFEHDPDVPY